MAQEVFSPMQTQHTAGVVCPLRRQQPSDHELEALVLLQLLLPPRVGALISDLAWDLHLGEAVIEAAVGRLMASELASRNGTVVSPTPVAIRFEQLWPIAL
jgi:hypothetical protein